MYYEVDSQLVKSREFAEHLLTLAQNAQDPDLIIQAHVALTVTTFSLGELAATREHAEQGVLLYDSKRHPSHVHRYGQDPGVACLAFGAVTHWLLGYPDQADKRSREAVDLGRKVGHPTSHALAHYFTTMVWQYRREASAVQEGAKATMAIATEHALPLWLANGLIMGGWAQAMQGASVSGIATLRKGIADWAATGAETHRTYFLGLLAEALARGGRIEEGLDVVANALTTVQGSGTVFHAAELHRLQGELLLQKNASELGDPAACGEAEACFHRAIAVAQSQQAKSLELRAIISLTRLYQKQNRQAEARPLLAACYHWFTEGFDTSDLQDAKTLLEEIA